MMRTRRIHLVALAITLIGALHLTSDNADAAMTIRDCDCWEAQGAWFETAMYCSQYTDSNAQQFGDWWCPNVTTCWVNESTQTVYWMAQCDYVWNPTGNPCTEFFIEECS